MKVRVALVGGLVGLLMAPSLPAMATFPGDPGLIAYVHATDAFGDPSVLRVVSLSGEPRVILRGRVGAPSWSPDGRRMLVTLRDRIRVVDPAGRVGGVAAEDRRKGDKVLDVTDAAWFPDSRAVAYIEDVYRRFSANHSVHSRSRLVLATVDGRRRRVLALDPEFHYRLPSVSPNGRWIVMSRSPKSPTGAMSSIGRVELVSIRIRTGAIHVLTPQAPPRTTLADISGRFAADGSIVFIRHQGHCNSWPTWTPPGCNVTVMSVHPTGGDERVLVDGPPDLNQDGRQDALTYVVASPDMHYLVLQVHEFTGFCYFQCYVYTNLYAFDRREGTWIRLGSGPRPEGQAPPPDPLEDQAKALFDMDWQPDCTIYGTRDDDVLVGTPGPDLICARGGNDVLRGRAGDDVLFGHGGDDRVVGGSGRDIVVGNGGRDRCDRDGADYSRPC